MSGQKGGVLAAKHQSSVPKRRNRGVKNWLAPRDCAVGDVSAAPGALCAQLTLECHEPKNGFAAGRARLRTHSTLGRTGYFWMICRFTSARIFPQRGCKLSEPNGFEPLRRVHDRIIRVFWPINFAHKR